MYLFVYLVLFTPQDKGSRTKKVLLLMAWPLRPNPPPQSLMPFKILERRKKGSKKV